MSVYTELSETNQSSLLSAYQAGHLTKFPGIHEGIENTHYFVNTASR
jgi:hypothetical protein